MISETGDCRLMIRKRTSNDPIEPECQKKVAIRFGTGTKVDVLHRDGWYCGTVIDSGKLTRHVAFVDEDDYPRVKLSDLRLCPHDPQQAGPSVD